MSLLLTYNYLELLRYTKCGLLFLFEKAYNFLYIIFVCQKKCFDFFKSGAKFALAKAAVQLRLTLVEL